MGDPGGPSAWKHREWNPGKCSPLRPSLLITDTSAPRPEAVTRLSLSRTVSEVREPDLAVTGGQGGDPRVPTEDREGTQLSGRPLSSAKGRNFCVQKMAGILTLQLASRDEKQPPNVPAPPTLFLLRAKDKQKEGEN